MRALTLTNRRTELTRLRREVDDFVSGGGLPAEIAFDVNVALEEVVTNVISYAFQDGGEHAIEVTLEIDGAELRAVVTDEGIPFDPREAAPPDLGLPVAERPLGGLGIFLARRLMDGLDYRREGTRNVVRLRKDVGP